MSILQTLIWTCDICGHTEVTYKEINPEQKLTLTTPGKKRWMLIHSDVSDDPEKLLCENCSKEMLEEVNGELIENDLKGQSWVI